MFSLSPRLRACARACVCVCVCMRACVCTPVCETLLFLNCHSDHYRKLLTTPGFIKLKLKLIIKYNNNIIINNNKNSNNNREYIQRFWRLKVLCNFKKIQCVNTYTLINGIHKLANKIYNRLINILMQSVAKHAHTRLHGR